MMPQEEPALSDAAQRALRLYIENLTKTVSNRAGEIAQNDGRALIDAQDVMAAVPEGADDYSLGKARFGVEAENEVVRFRNNMMLNLSGVLSAIAIPMVVLGLISAFYVQFRYSLQPGALFSLAIAVAGAFVAAFGYVSSTLLSKARSSSKIGRSRPVIKADASGSVIVGPTQTPEFREWLKSEFVNDWRVLEKTMQLVSESKFGLEDTRAGIAKSVNRLVESGVISSSLGDNVFFLLRLRNDIVHGESTTAELPLDDLRASLGLVERVNAELSQLI